MWDGALVGSAHDAEQQSRDRKVALSSFWLCQALLLLRLNLWGLVRGDQRCSRSSISVAGTSETAAATVTLWNTGEVVEIGGV